MGIKLRAIFGTLFGLLSLKAGSSEVPNPADQWECRIKASTDRQTNGKVGDPTNSTLAPGFTAEDAAKELVRTGIVQLDTNTGEARVHPNITDVLREKGFIFDVKVTKGSRCERCGNIQNPPK